MAQSNFTSLNDLVFPFRNYVLALPGWYPTWIDPLPGDFNQRHIIAASLHVPQIVLYVGKDPSGTLTKTEIRYNQLSKYVIEVFVLYPKTKVAYLDAVQSNLYYYRLITRYASFIKKRWGRPRLLHCYVVVRGGVAGYILSRRWKVPYILTENWTIYYPNDPGYLPRRSRFFKWSVKVVFNSITRFLPVTQNLYNQVQQLVKRVPATVIPNVVNTEVFFPMYNLPANSFRFIHVSTMIYQKNPHGLLRTFKALHQTVPHASLLMVGPYPDEVKQYAQNLGLGENTVRFTGAVGYKKVAELIQSSEALVLFSRYENLPCVLLETLCCGLPVISTRVGGIDEVIDDTNGILVENDNEVELLEAMLIIVHNYNAYNRQSIANRLH